MQTGTWTARGSPGDSRLAPVPPAPRDTAGKTSPLHSSEGSAGRWATWLDGREETLLPRIAWEVARQDPSIIATLHIRQNRNAPAGQPRRARTTPSRPPRHMVVSQ